MDDTKNSLKYDTDTPVLFLVFNRPELSRQVFSQIRKAQPQRLYIAADGPRRVWKDYDPDIKTWPLFEQLKSNSLSHPFWMRAFCL
ncbi:hypothetical protein AGMMS50239_04040 [Bacteroidia bacterium]|nr:hypothetical protein AGMMS50239_04040 [Bacteroidia bacterium]